MAHPVRRPAARYRRIVLAALAIEAVVLAGAPVVGMSYDLRSNLFLFLITLFALTADAAVALAWNRWPARLSLAGRVGGVAVISLVGAAAAFVLLNKQEGFYVSFSDLWGSSPQLTARKHYTEDISHARLDILRARWQPAAVAAARRGDGTVLPVRLWGSRSGIVHRGLVYLPAAYFTQPRAYRYPVVELMHGQPGGPPNYVLQLHIQSILDSEIQRHRIPPVIAVMPQASTHGVYTECVNAVHGDKVDTYLSNDVVDDVEGSFRTLSGRTWGIAGYSTGGYCAVNLASRHPDRYAAAASLSGYFIPAQDPGSARLYAGSRTALRANSPMWWATHNRPVAPPLYLFAARQDRFATAQLTKFSALVKRHDPLLPVTVDWLATGGHNWAVWRVGLPRALEFLSTYLPMPLVR